MADRPDVTGNAAIIDEFRANGGKVGGPFEGATLLLLHTTGAKSGRQRINPVMRFDIDGKLLIVGSYAGADVDPAWLHNLRANPVAHIEIGTDDYDVRARELAERRARRRIPADCRTGTGIWRLPVQDRPGDPGRIAAHLKLLGSVAQRLRCTSCNDDATKAARHERKTADEHRPRRHPGTDQPG